MKTIIAIIMMVGFALGGSHAFAQTATTTSTQVNDFLNQLQILRELHQGMSGDDVKILQAVLAAQSDVYPEGIVSGYFGPLTVKAVKKYQEKFGIPTVGRVGPMTMGKLNQLLAFNVGKVSTTVASSSTATSSDPVVCVSVPPGHLIAPGWLKKNGGVTPQVTSCQKLPAGIAKKFINATTTSTTTPTVVDRKAPVISAIAVTATATTSQITWSTNELATTKLIYGTSSPILSSVATTTSVIVDGLSKNHSVDLSSLTATTTYYLVAVSADASGNTATSSQRSFTTLGQ